MADGDPAFDAFLARLKQLPHLAEDVARAAAPRVEAVAKQVASSGVDPEGNAWQPTQAGNPPLQHAANALRAKAVGSIVELVLSGYHYFHDRGTKRLPQRRILPDAGAGMPTRIAAEVATAARDVFRRTMGAR